MAGFKIEIDDAPVMAAFNRLLAAVREAGPAIRAIAAVPARQTEDNFAAQSGPTGPWPALKAATLKGRRGKDGKMLQDTGRLAASVRPFHSATEAGIGTNVIYAAIHQLGGSIEKAAQSRLVRHRTDAKGNLLKSGALGGKGLVFAKDSHKRAVGRWFEQGAHTIDIPARPFLPVLPNRQLQAGLQDDILAILQKHLLG